MIDDDERIGPINGHTPWEPGYGCLIFIVIFVLVILVMLSASKH